MMNAEAFHKAYSESRNGTNSWTRHPLARNFVYSAGVKECAEAGCYWLLDILGTELPGVFRRNPNEYLLVVKVKVQANEAQSLGATLTGTFSDDAPPQYKRKVDYTDMPEGTWTFLAAQGADAAYCYLLTEH